jgi:phospholipase C
VGQLNSGSALTYIIDAFLDSGQYAARFSTGNAATINHVIFLLQENRSFDNYFGFLNAYRASNGWTTGDDGRIYKVDGLDGSKIISDISSIAVAGLSGAPARLTIRDAVQSNLLDFFSEYM